ncbi:RluA family pseudouridine synthase [Paenibacillus sp. FSL R5-0887]|jgi:23S rRNA pseudouridine1911/1915/1917 synthase|uniref:RluA family pseudouridine synthase n=1 Tax=Paenibacillus TaxID=44249 RepID=UPI00096C5A19|nr:MULTISPECIES: RluA family pseudouridine synthase [Paenibacillus]MDH6425687.1 23S rRNA pseudouridine1911/1915/1917 synthase [Paenibacillus sp. PastH-4]MDH6441707.1 23S rRNA pseudouridine1911/1915/1917 synthase [Paenibacillus sp. PastF-4]MDH6529782.1 23S rRNA pseudouridine1911/1915/1917 synthase [Paenibacillus sp. PastH-3]OMC65027.1 RNA pseudouridine synthase [Paenibacillus odorifer]OMC79703.1 RNA pseudouridine synthase [Paenibacillus odorifer]
MNSRRNPKETAKRGTRSHSKPTGKLNHKTKTTAAPKSFTVNEPSELLPFLLTHVTGRGRNAIKSILSRGQVSVNDKVVTQHNFQLHPGQNVTIDQEKPVQTAEMIGLKIVHEDEDLIIVQKDAGLLSIATAEENELTAYRQLMEHVRVSNPKNRIFVVHRLDRDTSGVMMFAKSERIQQALQTTWKDTVKERSYVALVEGAVKRPEGKISSWLKETSTLKMYSSPHEGDGLHAITHYKLIQANRHFSLLEVKLETGRKNQIRVHMADIGHPIAGDKKYGAETKTVGRLGLHARVLSFIHPTTGELMTFESPIPKTFLKYTAPAPTN